MNDNPFPKMTDGEIFDHYRRYTRIFSDSNWKAPAIMEELVRSGHATWIEGCPLTIQWLTQPLQPKILVDHLIQNGRLPSFPAPPLSFVRRVHGKVAAPMRQALQAGFWLSWLTLCIAIYFVAAAKYPHIFGQ